MKRLLILGGSDLQVGIIQLAKKMGVYVITCDYNPLNPGHKFSDEYYNVSTTDREGVFNLAKRLKIDGILAYASDPAAPVAAWICEKLSLATNSYEGVCILSYKDRFRSFMESKGNKSPKSKCFKKYSDASNYVKSSQTRLVIKPIDSSGSKGVYILEENSLDKDIFYKSLSFSKNKIVIIEEFINKTGSQVGGDGFMINGKLVFCLLGDLHFSSTNRLLPCSLSVPSMHSNSIKVKIRKQLEEILQNLNFQIGGFNFDVIINENKEVVVVEIGARNGGNMIPELAEYCTGVSMKKLSIQLALGMEVSYNKTLQEEKICCHYVIHSKKEGKIKRLIISTKLRNHIIHEHYNFNRGDNIEEFKNSSNRLGVFLLRFENVKEMHDMIKEMHMHYSIEFE